MSVRIYKITYKLNHLHLPWNIYDLWIENWTPLRGLCCEVSGGTRCDVMRGEEEEEEEGFQHAEVGAV